jgi:uncharacterized protein
MNCPVCSNELRELRVENIQVDVCDPGCGGIWFDAFELQRMDEPHETAGAKLVEAVSGRDTAGTLPPDLDSKRRCPRCDGVKLKKHFFSAQRRVRVDQCPNCGGYWLDSGELEAIRAETGKQSQKPAEPGQLSMETIRWLYRMKLEGRKPGKDSNQA